MAAAAEVTARSAGFHWTGFIDGQFTTIVGLAIEGVDGALAFFCAAHGDETKAAGALGFTVEDQMGLGNGAVIGEEVAQGGLGGLEGKISYVEFHTIILFL
jgi:hypothetical protein